MCADAYLTLKYRPVDVRKILPCIVGCRRFPRYWFLSAVKAHLAVVDERFPTHVLDQNDCRILRLAHEGNKVNHKNVQDKGPHI